MDRVYKKKKKKKTLHPLKTIFNLVIITICVFLVYYYKTHGNFNSVTQIFSKLDFLKVNSLRKTNTIEQSYSSNNSIEGQSSAHDQDGYITTFTTLNTKNQKTYKEFKQNIDSTWSDNEYWGGTMRENGCGITTMAIVASGYGHDITPEDLRQKYYPHLDAENMKKALENMGFKCTDFYFHKSYLNKKYIMDWLRTNRPVIICVGSEVENKWTSSSHYMALLDINNEGYVYLSNSNGVEEEETESRMV